LLSFGEAEEIAESEVTIKKKDMVRQDCELNHLPKAVGSDSISDDRQQQQH
jgi:hypothetical protein